VFSRLNFAKIKMIPLGLTFITHRVNMSILASDVMTKFDLLLNGIPSFRQIVRQEPEHRIQVRHPFRQTQIKQEQG
jgi:hypothetical protein